jgi:hypothetical protein
MTPSMAASATAVISTAPEGREWWAEEAARRSVDWLGVVAAALEMMVVGGILERKSTIEAAAIAEDWKHIAHEAWHAASWREAAQKYREHCPKNEIPPDRLDRLRSLIDGTTSLERAHHDINRITAARSTLIEALVLWLRRGVTELIRPEIQRRLSALDGRSLESVCLRLQEFQPTIAPAWSAEDADLLISTWKKLHEQC